MAFHPGRLADVRWQLLTNLRYDTLFRCLIVADLAFVALHVGRAFAARDAWGLGILNQDAFALDLEGSVSEIYQHVKVGAAALFLLGVFRATGARLFALLACLLAYVLADDALEIHERAGQFLADRSLVASRFGLTAADVGEALFLMGIGLVAIVLLAMALQSSTPEQFQTAALLVVPLAAFVFFGGVIDVLHAMAGRPFTGANVLFAIAEDGGELLSMSGVCALARAIYRADARPRVRVGTAGSVLRK